ncbi:putative acetamidase [[Candida] jaroonii]|uniref:Acetamidase n=1 Tax=[Candida] jaroonii TaxID=467808 RepID=A0ACA9YBI2_9ASCO|nr:putative acetamidase [[Candida] jaroonii]
MTTWEEVRDNKLATQKVLLKDYLFPEDKVPSPQELNDVTNFIDSSSLLTPEEKKITNLTVTELLKAYESSELSSVEVAKAYFKRSTLAHQLTNCLTEIRFDEALKEAEELDAFFKQNGKLKGPLHGIIVSFKDNLNIKGLASSMGFVGLANDIHNEDSAFATLIKRLGGIIICKTNTSAGMAYSETTNVLWGRTLNPLNRQYLNVGGSSGGEGALAALKGSCFGVGSDIGGSVRHPAALNNVYSIKPSSGRFPKYGTVSGQAGQESIVSIYGILAHEVEDLDFVIKTIIESKPYIDIDASCIPLDYRLITLPEKLTIGIMKSDGLNTITQPVLRGLEMVKNLLIEQGHNVIEWEDTYFREIRSTIYPFYSADGMKHVKGILEKYNEPPDSHLVNVLPACEDMLVSDLWKSQKERQALAHKYLELWNNKGERLDAIISASSPYPACLWNRIVPQPLNSIWNALDYTAGTFPVTRCDINIDKPQERTEFITESDKEVYETYRDNLEKFQGGPVSLQLICNKLEEEKCISLIKYVSGLLKESK